MVNCQGTRPNCQHVNLLDHHIFLAIEMDKNHCEEIFRTKQNSIIKLKFRVFVILYEYSIFE